MTTSNRDAIKRAEKAGCLVREIIGTGELYVQHREIGGGRGLRINRRRKDASRALLVMVKKAEALASAKGDIA